MRIAESAPSRNLVRQTQSVEHVLAKMHSLLESEDMGTRRFVFCIGFPLSAGLMTACVPAPGSVAIELRTMPPELQADSYEIRVVDSDNELIFSETMRAGSSLSYGDIPLGWVQISAAQICIVESELTSEFPTMRLIVEEATCTLTN